MEQYKNLLISWHSFDILSLQVLVHIVPKIVALKTMRANMGRRAYVGYNPWHMQ